MDLFIFRHGLAENDSRTGEDRDRELTDEGIRRTRQAGKALRRLGLEFDLILSSPYARAWRTAEILAEEMGAEKKLQPFEPLSSGLPMKGILTELRRIHRTHASVVLVGHEPDLSELISTLISVSPGLPITMKKGGLCRLSCVAPDPGACTLEWLLTPRLLEQLA